MSNLLALIEKQKPAIEAALPKSAGLNGERMARLAVTAIRINPKLAQCTPESFLGSLMVLSQLGLEPNTPLGLGYLIPYKRECTFQIGYKGLLELAYRTGQYQFIDAEIVHENDDFVYKKGLNPVLEFTPADKDRGKVIGYYAVYRLKNGGDNFKYWTKEACEQHGRKYSKSYNNGPWKTDFDRMALKTVLKDLLNYAPKSTQDTNAINLINMENSTVVYDEKTGETIPQFTPVEEVEKDNRDVKVIEAANEELP